MLRWQLNIKCQYLILISDINIEAQNVVIDYIFNLYPNIKVADYKFFGQMYIYPLLNVQKRYIDIFDMAIKLKRESFNELSLHSQIPLLYNLIGETVIKCSNESKYFDGAIESYDLLVTVIQKNSSKSPAISQEEAQGLLLNIYYNGYTTLYEKYQKYEDAVKSLDYVINNTDENHWMHSEAITKKNKFLELINNKPVSIEFGGPLLEPFYVNLSNDELYNGTLILKNAVINSPDIVIELSFNKIFEEDEPKLIEYCSKEKIRFRRYCDENDCKKEDKIGFKTSDGKYVDKIDVIFNSNQQQAKFQISTTNYCGDIFEIVAKLKSSNQVLAIKKLQVWRKYIIKNYGMYDEKVDQYLISKLESVQKCFQKYFIDFTIENQPNKLPFKGRLYGFETKEDNIVSYRNLLDNFNIPFEKSSNSINVIGVYSIVNETNDIVGGCTYPSINSKPFYSIYLSFHDYLESIGISSDKVAIHEFGHCFNLEHTNHTVENCYMIQDKIKSPEFCRNCEIRLKSTPIFLGY